MGAQNGRWSVLWVGGAGLIQKRQGITASVAGSVWAARKSGDMAWKGLAPVWNTGLLWAAVNARDRPRVGHCNCTVVLETSRSQDMDT